MQPGSSPIFSAPPIPAIPVPLPESPGGEHADSGGAARFGLLLDAGQLEPSLTRTLAEAGNSAEQTPAPASIDRSVVLRPRPTFIQVASNSLTRCSGQYFLFLFLSATYPYSIRTQRSTGVYTDLNG